MAISFETFLTRLAAVEVVGVKRAYRLTDRQIIPASVSTSDLPVQWVQIPGTGAPIGEEDPLYSRQVGGGGRIHRGAIVIAIGPLNQGTPSANMLAAIRMVDALDTGLRAVQRILGFAGPSWRIDIEPQLVIGEQKFWGVSAIVDVQG